MTTGAESSSPRARILVVDDEEPDRKLLEVLLAAEGFIIVTASSGAEALAIVARDRPDLILLDVVMPEMDGYQVAAAIKGDSRTLSIPIVMVTALDDRDTMMRALVAGAEDFLVKPVHRAELYMRVRNLLRLKAYVDHQEEQNQRLEREVGVRAAEQRQLEEQLRQSQKLEVVGQLAGGVAHDFNNILTAILGFCELLLMDLGPNELARTDVFEIKTAGERAAGLTRQLLAFSRKQILQAHVLDINGVIKGMEPMLRRLIAAHIDLVVSMQDDIGTIKIDPTQLEQIVINLLVNAADAMPRGGKLTIETSNVRLDENYRGHHLPVTPGDYVLLAVSDTGIGMDEATSRRVFEPFFTTKETGKGTGLGLATVYGIVKQSGGDIWVYSELGHGSVFKIYLPQVDAPVSAAVKGFLAPEIPRIGTETILLVEDDEAVRRLARLILERAGYRIIEAANPKEAFQAAKPLAGRIDLLLSDLIMPESDGVPLFDRLKKLNPDIRVLYISGYADEAVVRHGVIVEGTPFLQKPFTPLALNGKVREVLDAPPSGEARVPSSRRRHSTRRTMGTTK